MSENRPAKRIVLAVLVVAIVLASAVALLVSKGGSSNVDRFTPANQFVLGGDKDSQERPESEADLCQRKLVQDNFDSRARQATIRSGLAIRFSESGSAAAIIDQRKAKGSWRIRVIYCNSLHEITADEMYTLLRPGSGRIPILARTHWTHRSNVNGSARRNSRVMQATAPFSAKQAEAAFRANPSRFETVKLVELGKIRIDTHNDRSLSKTLIELLS